MHRRIWIIVLATLLAPVVAEAAPASQARNNPVAVKVVMDAALRRDHSLASRLTERAFLTKGLPRRHQAAPGKDGHWQKPSAKLLSFVDQEARVALKASPKLRGMVHERTDRRKITLWRDRTVIQKQPFAKAPRKEVVKVVANEPVGTILQPKIAGERMDAGKLQLLMNRAQAQQERSHHVNIDRLVDGALAKGNPKVPTIVVTRTSAKVPKGTVLVMTGETKVTKRTDGLHSRTRQTQFARIPYQVTNKAKGLPKVARVARAYYDSLNNAAADPIVTAATLRKVTSYSGVAMLQTRSGRIYRVDVSPLGEVRRGSMGGLTEQGGKARGVVMKRLTDGKQAARLLDGGVALNGRATGLSADGKGIVVAVTYRYKPGSSLVTTKDLVVDAAKLDYRDVPIKPYAQK